MATAGGIRRMMRDGFWRTDIPPISTVVGTGMVSGIGLSTLGIHLLHLFTLSNGPFATFIGVVVPLVFSVVLVAMGVWMWTRWPRFDEMALRVGSWCLAGALVLVSVGSMSVAYQLSKEVPVADSLFVLANHATVGAILGTLMGIYDGQRNVRGRGLRAERERTRRLVDLLTILNRILRHDIRNTVNIIIGNSELIRKGSADATVATETITERARKLQRTGDRARQLVELVESDSVRPSPTDIAPMVQAKAFKLKDDHPELELETDVPGSVEACTISMIETAVDELLENAVEHNDAETPHVEVGVSGPETHRENGREEPGTVVVRIRDNGRGIPSSETVIFERGYETALSHATGIGLWTVYWVVTESGGHVTFEENDRRGSTVEVHLPAACE